MLPEPIIARPYRTEAAAIRWDGLLPTAIEYDDSYWGQGNPAEEKRFVFPLQHDLTQRAKVSDFFVILELGFGFGHNFLQTLAEWRKTGTTSQLHYIAIERSPPSQAVLKQTHERLDSEGWQRLISIYPPQLEGWYVVWLAQNVRLTLIFEDATTALPRLDAKVDAFYLDGFKPSSNPALFNPFVFNALQTLAQPGATVSSYSVAGTVKQGLKAAGFSIEKRSGFGHKRSMLFASAPQQWRGQRFLKPLTQIVGAGIAAQFLVRSFDRFGLKPTVFADPNHPGASNQPVFNIYPQISLDRDRQSEFAIAANYFALNNLSNLDQTTLYWQSTNVQKTQKMARLSQLLPADYLSHEDGAFAYHQAGTWRPTELVETLRAKIIGFKAHDSNLELLNATDQRCAPAAVTILATGQGSVALCRLPLKSIYGQSIVVETLQPLPGPLIGDLSITPLGESTYLIGSTYRPEGTPDLGEAFRTQSLLERLTELVGDRKILLRRAHQGYRIALPDRTPVVGRLPIGALKNLASSTKLAPGLTDASGLMVLMGLGSHGATLGPLAAEAITSQVVGVPSPLPRDHLQLLRPDRFLNALTP